MELVPQQQLAGIHCLMLSSAAQALHHEESLHEDFLRSPPLCSSPNGPVFSREPVFTTEPVTMVSNGQQFIQLEIVHSLKEEQPLGRGPLIIIIDHAIHLVFDVNHVTQREGKIESVVWQT